MKQDYQPFQRHMPCTLHNRKIPLKTSIQGIGVRNSFRLWCSGLKIIYFVSRSNYRLSLNVKCDSHVSINNRQVYPSLTSPTGPANSKRIRYLEQKKKLTTLLWDDKYWPAVFHRVICKYIAPTSENTVYKVKCLVNELSDEFLALSYGCVWEQEVRNVQTWGEEVAG